MGAIFTIYEEKMQGRSSRLSKITLWLSAILVGNFSKSNLHPKIIILDGISFFQNFWIATNTFESKTNAISSNLFLINISK
jgi:hypothetical protein